MSEQATDRRLLLGLALFALACIAVNPPSYIGGGGDDARYFEAARCWAAHGGMCVPADHWSSRWPVLAPLAAGIALFGETCLALSFGPLVYWAAAVAMVWLLGSRWVSRDAGLVGAAIFVSTPIVTSVAMQPTADMAELAFELAALAAATHAYRIGSRAWAIFAGVLAALAFEDRETSAVTAAVCALVWLFLPAARRELLLWAIPGFLAVIAMEMLAYFIVSGDPLFRYRLALGHVAVVTTELPEGFDTSQSPFFNPAYIAAWKREMRINWFWPIDPWINLLLSPKVAATLLAGILGPLLFWNRIDRDRRRATGAVVVGAALVSLLLVYGLALDPKSRLFLLLAAAASVAAGGFLGGALRRADNVIAVALLGLVLAFNLVCLYAYPAIAPLEPIARRWIAADGARIEIDATARQYLVFVPQAQALPPVGSGRPLRLTVTLGSCQAQAAQLSKFEQVPLRLLRRGRRVNLSDGQFELCLFALPSPARTAPT
jgi:4-amino-4-deoxy-L-arabinose transferase-like glycosyltransferase